MDPHISVPLCLTGLCNTISVHICFMVSIGKTKTVKYPFNIRSKSSTIFILLTVLIRYVLMMDLFFLFVFIRFFCNPMPVNSMQQKTNVIVKTRVNYLPWGNTIIERNCQSSVAVLLNARTGYTSPAVRYLIKHTIDFSFNTHCTTMCHVPYTVFTGRLNFNILPVWHTVQYTDLDQ